jgi:hypothetical protein
MILTATNVIMYAEGAPHPHKDPSVTLLEQVATGSIEAVTSAEVLQEILHRYRAIVRPCAVRPPHDPLDRDRHLPRRPARRRCALQRSWSTSTAARCRKSSCRQATCLEATVALRTRWANVLSSALGGPTSAPSVTHIRNDWSPIHLLCSDGPTKRVSEGRGPM